MDLGDQTVLFEGKMRAIFSMLFGAGMLVLTSRLEQRGAAAESADIYYRRLLWLVAFGLAHAYFVWWGDILFFYGVLGLFLFPLRRLAGPTLVVAGLVPAAHRRGAQSSGGRRRSRRSSCGARGQCGGRFGSHAQ